MADEKYYTLSEATYDKLCLLLRESYSVADAIDDSGVISTESTFSSLKITELLESAGVTNYEELSNIPLIKDTNGNITINADYQTFFDALGKEVVPMLKTDYEALSEEEQNNGMVYIVIDEDTEIVDLSVFVKKADIENGSIEIDANTVNNHTVESDVPSNAVFTDTVYDDTDIKNNINSLLVPIAVLTGTVERSEDGTGCASIPITSLTSGKIYIIKNKATVIPCQGVWLLNFIGKGYTELIRISQVGGDTYSMVKYSDDGTTIDVYSSDSSPNDYVFYELPY